MGRFSLKKYGIDNFDRACLIILISLILISGLISFIYLMRYKSADNEIDKEKYYNIYSTSNEVAIVLIVFSFIMLLISKIDTVTFLLLLHLFDD